MPCCERGVRRREFLKEDLVNIRRVEDQVGQNLRIENRRYGTVVKAITFE